jgi:flagellar motor switch protein FliG
VALAVAHLEPAHAAAVLGMLPERLQSDVAHRVATMSTVSPAKVESIGEAMYRSLQGVFSQLAAAGGPQVVADILNLSHASVEKSVLDQIDAQSPEVGEQVRVLMFVLSDIAKLTDSGIRLVLETVADPDLGLAMRGCDEALFERLRSVLDDAAWEQLQQLVDASGPAPAGEVEAARIRVVQAVRRLEEEGKITVTRADERLI